MKIAFAFAAVLLAVGLPSAPAQQRADFERQRFDRSRFQRPAPGAPDAPAPAASAPAAPAPAAPEFSFSQPAAPAADAAPPRSNAPPSAPASDLANNPRLDDIPTRWHTNPRNHDELLEIQKQTGACILIYFKDTVHPQQKGLCSWFERVIAADIKWRRAMRYYLKLEITLPGNNAAQELATKYRAGHTPAIVVLQIGRAHV